MRNKPHVWTRSDDEFVADRLREGWTAARIGEAMQLTRNAIVSRVSRTPHLAMIGFSNALPAAAKRWEGHVKGEKKPAPFVPLFKDEIRLPLPGSHKILVDLGHNDCRYPMKYDEGVIGSYLFCSKAVWVPGAQYCQHHYNLCLTPGRAPVTFGRRR